MIRDLHDNGALAGEEFSVLRGMSDPVVVIDNQGRVVFTNEAIASLGDAFAESGIGREFQEVFRPPCEIARQVMKDTVAQVLDEGRAANLPCETVFRKQDGEETVADVAISPVFHRDGTQQGAVLIFRDVTSRSRESRELARKLALARQANASLVKANSHLEQFAYVASHDLQEPLRSVMIFTEIIAQREPADAEMERCLAYIQAGARRMSTLIQALLNLSRLRHHTSGFINDEVNAREALDEAISNLGASIAECSARVTYGSLPCVGMRRAYLVQVLQNLIGNALKYRSEKTPEIHVVAERVEREWIFEVRDNGIGMDMESAGNIFRMFRRANDDGSVPGTGIGLAICSWIIELYGGRIWAESAPGVGSTFFFSIPDELPATRTGSVSSQ